LKKTIKPIKKNISISNDEIENEISKKKY
jgi:hypothetical protein